MTMPEHISDSPALLIDNLSFRYQRREDFALRNLSFQVQSGDILLIAGSYVLNEVAFGLENLGLPRDEILQRADETLNFLGISHLRDRETFSTSGGEKQKVDLAGVLSMRPRIFLLDEPLASLDPMSSHEALQFFRWLANEGIAIMIVEHRVEDVLTIHPENVLYLECGEQLYYGAVDGLLQVVDYHHIQL